MSDGRFQPGQGKIDVVWLWKQRLLFLPGDKSVLKRSDGQLQTKNTCEPCCRWWEFDRSTCHVKRVANPEAGAGPNEPEGQLPIHHRFVELACLSSEESRVDQTGVGVCMNVKRDCRYLYGASLLAGPIAFAAMLLIGMVSQPVLAAGPDGYARSDYVLPPGIAKEGFSFAGMPIPFDRKEVRQRIHEQVNVLLMDRRSKLMDWFDRLAESGATIRKVLADENVPPDLIYLAAVAGDFLPNSKTRAGGVGWWALAAPKAKKKPAGVPWTMTDDWDDRRDPILSTRIACAMFKAASPKTGQPDWLLVISAFADGADKVEDVLAKAPGFSYWDLVMPTYAEVLIPRLIALKVIDTHRAFYGVEVPPKPQLTYDFLGRLPLLKDLPLYVVAQWCGTTPRFIWELNPGVSPANGLLPKADKKHPAGFPLRVPAGMGEKVRKNLLSGGYLQS
jgi:membrane-bound lytic murein transglycosylase D